MFNQLLYLTFATAVFLTTVVEAIKITANKGFGLKEVIPKYVYAILNFVGSFGSALLCYKIFFILEEKAFTFYLPIYTFVIIGSWALSAVCGATIIKGLVKLVGKLFDKTGEKNG